MGQSAFHKRQRGCILRGLKEIENIKLFEDPAGRAPPCGWLSAQLARRRRREPDARLECHRDRILQAARRCEASRSVTARYPARWRQCFANSMRR